MCVRAKSLQSCLTLCDPMDRSLPGSSVHGIFQARVLEWMPFPSPVDLPDPGIKPASLRSPALVGRFFTTSATWETHIKQYIKANETGFQPFFFTPSIEAHSYTHTSYNTIW